MFQLKGQIKAKFPVGKSKLFLGLMRVSPGFGICISKGPAPSGSIWLLLCVVKTGLGMQHLPPFLENVWGWSNSELSIPPLTPVEIGWWL